MTDAPSTTARITEWMTAAEAADYLRLPVDALYQRRARGQVKAYTLGSRQLRFRRRTSTP